MKLIPTLLTTLLLTPAALAQGAPAPATRAGAGDAAEPSIDDAGRRMQAELEAATRELADLRERIVAETLPLSRELRELEGTLLEVQAEFQSTTRLLDGRTLDLSNLQSDNKLRRDEVNYLSGLMGDFVRTFESRLHIAEVQRYEAAIEKAQLAIQNPDLSETELFQAQADIVRLGFERIEGALGGDRFAGRAVGPDGLVHEGRFLLVGNAALFLSDDGGVVGTAEQRLGSLEPTVVAFADPLDADAAAALVEAGSGLFPLDPTLGDAHKLAATEVSTLDELKKGGLVMYPIVGLAAASLTVALLKWLSMLLVRKPSRRKVEALFDAVGRNDVEEARARVRKVRGPAGRMLAAGVEHIDEPRELIEEVMYEKVLATRLRLNAFLPFIAITAAAAPLLGLLGTVTGIIETFKLITVFGSGDVQTLSGGISEALITTKWGLIVAIPSLLLHSLLSRKARGIVARMEGAAVGFVNHVSRAAPGHVLRPQTPQPAPITTESDQVKARVGEILSDLLGPLQEGGAADGPVTTSRPG